ncbi:peroxidase-related enzyme [bacterium AH-315-C07]|nr:peroxidase-related enzyme [bacterium AH-315-C07]
MAFIKVIDESEAEGQLKDIYNDLVDKRGRLADIHKVQSLNPESIIGHMDLYMTIMFGESPLKRYQREMLGVVVSRANNCRYCQIHHAHGVNHYWKDDNKTEKFRADYRSVDLEPMDTAMCDYAWELTRNPSSINEQDHIQSLRKAGLEDRAILDAALIISYFNFVNRMVLGLGVHLEADKGVGFKY